MKFSDAWHIAWSLTSMLFLRLLARNHALIWKNSFHLPPVERHYHQSKCSTVFPCRTTLHTFRTSLHTTRVERITWIVNHSAEGRRRFSLVVLFIRLWFYRMMDLILDLTTWLTHKWRRTKRELNYRCQREAINCTWRERHFVRCHWKEPIVRDTVSRSQDRKRFFCLLSKRDQTHLINIIKQRNENFQFSLPSITQQRSRQYFPRRDRDLAYLHEHGSSMTISDRSGTSIRRSTSELSDSCLLNDIACFQHTEVIENIDSRSTLDVKLIDQRMRQ